MKYLFALIRGTIRSYDYRDTLVSLVALAVFSLMLVKLIVFPYGVFGFGESNVYTEGLVSGKGISLINPLFVDYNDADRAISRVVFSGLMKYDPAKRAIVDDMGQLTINEDKTQYTFVLRDGLTWHDGKPLTADDVYFTFHDIILSPSFPNEILKTNFAGVEVLQEGDKKIIFKLLKPNIFFVTNLTTGILPRHVLKDVDPAELPFHSFNTMPVGSGPYMVTEPPQKFQNGRMQITLSRTPQYYGASSEIENLRFIVFPDMAALLDEVNIVNGVERVTGDFIDDFKEHERFSLVPYELPQYTAVFMNMESQILKQSNVRLALQKSIDKKVLMEQFVDKIAVDTPLMELNQDDWVYQASGDQAHGALKDAGYRFADDDKEKKGPRVNKRGDPLQLNFIVRMYEEGSYNFQESQKVVNFLEKSWEEVGFDIQVELLNDEQYKERITTRKYDLLLVGHNLGYNLDTYSYWHSTQAGPMGQNFSNYKSFQVDTLIEDIRSIFNQEKKERQLKELAERIKSDVPAVFLYRPVYHYASDGKVGGIVVDGMVFPSDRFAFLPQWVFAR